MQRRALLGSLMLPSLAAVLAAETTLWGNLIREAGIRAE